MVEGFAAPSNAMFSDPGAVSPVRRELVRGAAHPLHAGVLGGGAPLGATVRFMSCADGL